jgi:DNA helicase HerA-like ATPase
LKKIEESARKVIEYELRNLYRKVENAIGWSGNYSRNGLKDAKDLYNNEIRIKEKAIFNKFGEIDMKEYNISKYLNRIQNTLFSESLRDVFRKNKSYQEAKDFYDKNIKPNINNDKVNLQCFFYLLRNNRYEDFSQVFDRIGDFKDVIFKI